MSEAVKARITEELAPSQLELEMSGNHCTITIVSDRFEGLNKVRRQQLVYACLNDEIASGEIHAVNIHALAPAEI